MKSCLLFISLAAGTVSAAVQTKEITYDANGTKCKGMLAWDDAISGKRPGVLVFHEWWGLDGYAKKRAEMLAKEGYVAFAADMYGEGKVAEHPTDARKMATEVRSKSDVWLARAEAAMTTLQAQDIVDKNKIAAIGYCFGGSTALTLALNGADLKAVGAFHAGLPPVTTEQARKIKGRVKVYHGADDAFISKESIDQFKKAFDEAKVVYEFIPYPNTVHSFTVPDVDQRNLAGMKYNKVSDENSWESLLKMLKNTTK